MTSDRIRLGDATLTRVIETQADNLPVEVFPFTPQEVWSQDSEFNLAAHHQVEFDDWRWGYLAEAPDLVVPFKRAAYESVQAAWSKLPAGGRRILQDASGYKVTIVSGVVTRRDDRDTGARPGRLVRAGSLHH